MPFLFSSNFYCNPKLIQIDTRMKLIIAICLLAVAVLGKILFILFGKRPDQSINLFYRKSNTE